MSESINMQSATTVYSADTGERIIVPFGEGLPEPDRDNIYCHQWSDQLYYKFPEEPGSGFEGVVAPHKMFLAELAALSDADALRQAQSSKNAIKLTEDLLRICIASGVTAFLWGPPGHAKTAVVESFQKEKDENGRYFNVESEELSQVDATVINGIHYVHPEDFTMKRSIPEAAKKIVSTYRETGRLTIYLMDELTLAGTGQQGAALRTITHGEMGSISIKKYTQMVIASNPKSTVKRANELLESAVNRGAHFAWKMEHEMWFSRWKRGFVPDYEERRPDKEPDTWTKKFTREILRNNPAGVPPFESSYDDDWSVENLIPRKREMSPRTLNDYMKAAPIIRRVCSELDVSHAVRDHYLYELARAMLGEKWAQSALTALAMLADSFGGFDEISERVEDIDFATEEFPEEYGDALLRTMNGDLIGLAEISSVMEEALSQITSPASTARTRTRALVVAWSVAMAAKCTHNSQVPAVMNTLADIAQYLSNHRDLMAGMPDKIVPPFVSTTLREQLREIVAVRSGASV